MSATELDHLIKMMNQIADNIAIGEDHATVAPKVVDHVNRFWAKPMKEKIIAYATTDGERLKPAAKLAARQLAG